MTLQGLVGSLKVYHWFVGMVNEQARTRTDPVEQSNK